MRKSLCAILSIMTISAMLCMFFYSCTKENGGGTNPNSNSNTDNPSNPTIIDPEGVVTANLRNDGGYVGLLETSLLINTANNFMGSNLLFANVGEVSGVGYINSIPNSGWTNQVAVIPGNGYVAKRILSSGYEYARLYVVRYLTGTDGGILGAEIKYEDFWCSEPIVVTSEVTEITESSALCGGTISVVSNAAILARGVCWGNSPSPTISGSHSTDGTGSGTFNSTITGLNCNTYYYLRAYATTEAGTRYGEEKQFVTRSGEPIVVTLSASNITTNSATLTGEVTNDGGSTVIARGFCWSTNPTPTISDNHSTDGSGEGEFTSTIQHLEEDTWYYFRAYATNSEGTSYGSQKTFITPPQGAISGLFSISDTETVHFSQGNLQYQASTNTWRFADNQWDYIGSDNSNISSSFNGWIDLFGWGTSGYNHGSVCYQPWSTSNSDSDYYAYGSSTCNLYDQTGRADWGYNAISNGGNTENRWRTLTREEWAYLFNDRVNASNLYGVGQIRNVRGLIVLPDDWTSLPDNSFNPDRNHLNYYTYEQWSQMESAGALFLPIAGYREENHYLGGYAGYWSSSYCSGGAYGLSFVDGYEYINPHYHNVRCFGFSVRLVH